MDKAGSEPQAASAEPADVALAATTIEVADVSFGAFLDAQAPPRIEWARSDGFEVVAADSAVELVLPAPGDQLPATDTPAETPPPDSRFDQVRAQAEGVFAGLDYDGPRVARPRAYGGFSFFPDHEPTAPWTGFPAAAFVIPRLQLTRAEDRTWLTVATAPDEIDDQLEAARETLADLPAMQPIGDRPGITGTDRVVPEPAWTEMVEDALSRIHAGDLRKVVLATALDVSLASDLQVPAVLERLRRTYPDCYRFLVEPTEDAGFFGAPPERLVELTDRTVTTEALAGSVERGDTPAEDTALADSLRESGKLQEEQGVVVDAIREALEPMGTVTVGEQRVRKLTNIQHLQTPIEATLTDDAHVLSVVEALHPTPAVGGVPRDDALAFIREAEPFDRGWYAAPIGWFDAAGDGEFAVGIRAGVAAGDRATLYAGNGIVTDSDPAEEWAEIQPKYRPILDELGDDPGVD